MDAKESKEMNVKIQNASPHKEGGNNKGSCAALATYLEHEDEERIAEGKDIMPFLTPDGVEVTKGEVIEKIDRNHSHLGKNDDKFYSITVAPSAEEIKAMGKTEAEQYKSGLKLMRAISDSYAENFNNAEVKTASDLIFFWKFHFTRGDDGDLQFHMHGMVSRKSKGIGGKSLKLSPMTKHSNTENGPVKGGFNRKAFFERCEKLFDALFHYDRKVAESFAYSNAIAHGTPEQKAEQAKRLAAENKQELMDKIASGISRRRDSVKAHNDVQEVVELLAQDNATLSAGNDDILGEAMDLANFCNVVSNVFAVSANREALELNLMAAGATISAQKSADGVEDLIFIKRGKKISGKDILSSTQHRAVLNAWEKFSGETPAYKVRAARAAALEAAHSRNIAAEASQHVSKLKIGRR